MIAPVAIDALPPPFDGHQNVEATTALEASITVRGQPLTLAVHDEDTIS
jgi:hypothetical protein